MRVLCALAGALLLLQHDTSGGQGFVGRSGERLLLNGRQVYLLGANAYSLREHAALGDSSAVQRVCADAAALGMTFIRTWAFFDSPDSTNPAVIQYAPGRYNETALQALDYVIVQARRYGLRLLFPLVNSWDDFGGMNQYVRWRSAGMPQQIAGETHQGQIVTVSGARGRSYRVYGENGFGHDDFYTDSTIRSWYSAYAAMLAQRVNTITGTRYLDDTTILGWELANEPRSSDPSGQIVLRWLAQMAAFVKSVDPNHLVGTGEEGFDVSAALYSSSITSGHEWMVNGTAGVAYSGDISIGAVDFAGIHLYPESWGIPNSAGNTWIGDHLRIASTVGKPLLLGEFGVVADKATTYESWLTTILLDGGAGAAVWQLLDSAERDPEGFGVHCPGTDQTCSVLEALAGEFSAKSRSGSVALPAGLSLLPNYPNPFNRETIITYTLPADARVRLEVFNVLGERVLTLVDWDQRGGIRKELLDGAGLASGAYVYRLTVVPEGGNGGSWEMSRKLLLLK